MLRVYFQALMAVLLMLLKFAPTSTLVWLQIFQGARCLSIPGADFNMARCSPGELDPHAVSGVFKAFLRER